MGNYIFSTRSLLRELYDDAANRDSTPRFRPRHSAVAGRARRNVRLRFPDQPDSRRAAGRGRLLARRGDHRRLLRGQHRSARGEPGAQSLQSRMAAADRQLSGRAREVHLRRRGPPRAGHRFHRLERLHPLRRHGAQFGAVSRRARPLRRAGGGLGDSRQLRHRPRARRSAGRFSTRTCASPRANDRLRPGARQAPPSRHRERHRGGRGAPLLGGHRVRSSSEVPAR